MPKPTTAHWIAAESPPRHPVHAYKLRFELGEGGAFSFQVSADERYSLYLDGQRIGRGPTRGLPEHWSTHHYELNLSAGTHVLVALVWSMGEKAPIAQTTQLSGFYCKHLTQTGQSDLSTGVSDWTSRPVDGIHFEDLGGQVEAYYAVGADYVMDGAEYPFGIERGEGSGWQPVRSIPVAQNRYSMHGESLSPRILRESALPEMYFKPWEGIAVRAATELPLGQSTSVEPVVSERGAKARFQSWLEQGTTLTLPAKSTWRVVIDLNDYACAYPELVAAAETSAVVTLRWAESLYEDVEGTRKGHRDEVTGKCFIGLGDRFMVAHAQLQKYSTLWWRAGRYLELTIEVGDSELTLKSLSLFETGYPYVRESAFHCEDPRFTPMHQIADRSLQACSHETYVDCPYYEQLMYAGDTRLDMLVHYATTGSVALQKHALELFDWSRDRSGVTACRVPSRLRQVIPPFSFLWVNSVHDFACWRSEPAFVSSRLPGVRAVIEYGLSHLGQLGLVDRLEGWNFIDWVDGWESGTAPGLDQGPSALVNWQFLGALQAAAELEAWVGDSELAERYVRYLGGLAEKLAEHYWDAARGLFADDLSHSSFSEHSQCLAVLSGTLDSSKLDAIRQHWPVADDLAPASIYFSHYVLEAYRMLRLETAFYNRLNFWLDLPEQGFKTTPESPEPARSDCHAWGAHPLYHAYASQLGIRPDGFGFKRVQIQPMPGPLTEMAGHMVHPAGLIQVSMQRLSGHNTVAVTLPDGLEGSFHWEGHLYPLQSGSQTLEWTDGLESQMKTV